jgi:hypothetical protein
MIINQQNKSGSRFSIYRNTKVKEIPDPILCESNYNPKSDSLGQQNLI